MEETTLNSENAKPAKKGNVPLSDVNFGNVATTVSEKWESNNWLTLKWLTAAQFKTDALSYNTTLNDRMQSGSTRPQITQSLKVLDKKIASALSYVKGYITDKYKKENATSYYAAFGIEYKGNKYIFPTDQNKKMTALTLMIEALQTNGFADKEYGVTFWTPIKTQYKALVEQATALDGQVSVKVGDKNTLKNNLKRGLNSIVSVLKANYPDTFKQELRDWGFQKEKY